MRGHCTLDGIVLRTYDIGEADRLCVLLTRERGRIVGRARAVRKLGSRMGALLLPGRKVTVDIREEGEYLSIAAARLSGDIANLSHPLAFTVAQQGIELVLLLTEDGEPLPDVFDLLFQFLHAVSADHARALQPFQLRLFHVLGLLPSHSDDKRFAALDDDDRAFVRLCVREADFGELCAAIPTHGAIATFADALREQHAHRDLRSSAVYAAMA